MTGVDVVLRRFAEHLDSTAIPFMVAGSFASSVHGLPRTTQDIDLVIDPPSFDALACAVNALERAAYYADLGAAHDAFLRRSMFNVIDMSSGWKFDLILRKNRPFSVSEFKRRTTTSLLGVPVCIATAEDTIVAKLEWSKDSGGSERQRRDVAGILAMNDASLDIDYIERWVKSLGLAEEWLAALSAPLD